MRTKLLTSSERDIAFAGSLLRSGANVAFPTETVYGLGANIFSCEALAKIYAIKGRPQDNPLIAHVSGWDDVLVLAKNLPPYFRPLFDAFFPGPLTLVIEKSDLVPSIAAAGLSSIGIRMPAHPVALALIKAAGMPIAAPSANLSGSPSATTAEHVLADFDGKIPAVIDGGACMIGIESTVVSLLSNTPVILRPGYITTRQIEEVIQASVITATDSDEVLSPGMKYRHYAPKAPVELFANWEALLSRLDSCSSCKVLVLTNQDRIALKSCIFAPLSAKSLYKELRRADMENFDFVFAEICHETLKDAALCNRLYKAAAWI